MGTFYAVTLSDPFPGGEPALQQEVDALLVRMNHEISTYDPNSLISRFNQGSGQPPMAIPATMANIVQQGIDAGHHTAGKLDVTVGPLVNLWGFGPDKRPVKRPSAEQIANAHHKVGIDRLTLVPEGITSCSASASPISTSISPPWARGRPLTRLPACWSKKGCTTTSSR